MSQRIQVRLILTISSLLILSGCGLSIGPKTKTEYIIARPGHPAQVVEQKTILTILPENASQPVSQDVGGWIVMPREHYEALMKALDKTK